jgi:hypothetical protein
MKIKETMSRKVIMTTNERRLQVNQMRASYRGVQLLRQDRTRFIQHSTSNLAFFPQAIVGIMHVMNYQWKRMR